MVIDTDTLSRGMSWNSLIMSLREEIGTPGDTATAAVAVDAIR